MINPCVQKPIYIYDRFVSIYNKEFKVLIRTSRQSSRNQRVSCLYNVVVLSNRKRDTLNKI